MFKSSPIHTEDYDWSGGWQSRLQDSCMKWLRDIVDNIFLRRTTAERLLNNTCGEWNGGGNKIFSPTWLNMP